MIKIQESMMVVGIFVPVSAIFPEVTCDFTTFCSLVRSLSRTDALFWCARLNLILSNPAGGDAKSRQQYAVTLFFDSVEIEQINRFVLEQKESNVTVFFRAQLLEMVRWICLLAKDHPDDGSSFQDPSMRRRFAQAALIASDLWAARVYRDRLEPNGGSLRVARQRLMPVARQSVAANSKASDLSQVVARGLSIYGEPFLRAYPNAHAEFQAHTGLTFRQYFACVVAIAIHYTHLTPGSTGENPGIFSRQNIGRHLRPEMAAIIDKYLEVESQNADTLRTSIWKSRTDADGLTGLEPFDYLSLRSRPIIRAADGRCIVLDPAFYSEKTSVGPLFAIVEHINQNKRHRLANTVFGAFGYGFEAHVLGLLQAMYPSSSLLSNRLSCNVRGLDEHGNDVEIADACLDDVTDVVMFEAKGTFINEKVAMDLVEGTYLEELRKKYAAIDRSDGERDQGAGQLARAIRGIARGELRPHGQRFAAMRCTYPVLVVYDTSLNGPGHAEFLAEEFANALNPDETLHNGYMRVGSLTVAPLTLMTIADLEGLESSVENFRLVDLLRDYCCTTSNGFRMSLHDFMASSGKKYRFIHSKRLADRSIKMLDEIKQMLFPESAD